MAFARINMSGFQERKVVKMANEKRLISYDVLIAHLDSCIEQGKGLFKSVCVAIKCFVEQMPTAEAVEVVHGRWIDITYADVQCSVCGFQECGVTPDNTHYCPNCGADMRGDGND